MDRYLDIRILPDPEFPTQQLMNALFAKLHRCLARLESKDLGVSFPEVNEDAPHLGRVLRLHASDDGFAKVMRENWLIGMRDHVQIGEVSELPEAVGNCLVRRVQAKSNPDRIRRRQMKRHGWSEEEARSKISDGVGRLLKLPFLTVESHSTGHRFRLFLRHEPLNAAAAGTFNAYGLSASATVPWF